MHCSWRGSAGVGGIGGTRYFNWELHLLVFCAQLARREICWMRVCHGVFNVRRGEKIGLETVRAYRYLRYLRPRHGVETTLSRPDRSAVMSSDQTTTLLRRLSGT